MARLVVTILLWTASHALAADAQWIAAFGRATESQETDGVRLAYRHPLHGRSRESSQR